MHCSSTKAIVYYFAISPLEFFSFYWSLIIFFSSFLFSSLLLLCSALMKSTGPVEHHHHTYNNGFVWSSWRHHTTLSSLFLIPYVLFLSQQPGIRYTGALIFLVPQICKTFLSHNLSLSPKFVCSNSLHLFCDWLIYHLWYGERFGVKDFGTCHLWRSLWGLLGISRVCYVICVAYLVLQN